MAITKEELKIVVKDSVKEALKAEMMKLRAFMMSGVSSREQKDIERLYNKPSRKSQI